MTTTEMRERAAESRRLADACEAGHTMTDLGFPGLSRAGKASCLRQEADMLEYLVADREAGPLTEREIEQRRAANAADRAHHDRRRTILTTLSVAGVPVTYHYCGSDLRGTSTGGTRGDLVEVRSESGDVHWVGWGWITLVEADHP